jgi:hypothetical protein
MTHLAWQALRRNQELKSGSCKAHEPLDHRRAAVTGSQIALSPLLCTHSLAVTEFFTECREADRRHEFGLSTILTDARSGLGGFGGASPL